jgi:WhiB family redox-sensing transcriptional regulator
MRKQLDWRMRAACRYIDPELFFPEGTAGRALQATGLAKRICGTCLVQTRCLSWALDHSAAFGIWGGLTDDALIRVQAMAIRAICSRLTAGQLEALRRSVERACLMPKHIGWDDKSTAHAEIFDLLADATDHPLLAQTLNSGAGLVRHLMMAAGPAADMITANSRKRLLALLSADDPEGAAHEMERHLIMLRFIGRLTACSSPSGSRTRERARDSTGTAGHVGARPSIQATAGQPVTESGG